MSALRVLLLLAVPALAIGSPSACAAGQTGPPQTPREILVLVGGNRLTGNSLGVEDGRLRWQLPTGGEMVVPVLLIDRIEHLPTTDEIVSTETGGVVTANGAVPVEVGDAKRDPDGKPAAAEVPPVLATPLPLSEAWFEAARSTYDFATEQNDAWTKRFELGGTWVDGNTETSEVFIGGVVERKLRRVFHQLEWSGRRATAGSAVTQNRWLFNGMTDFDKDGDWIVFASHRHTFDELADLQYRGNYATGLGYRFVNEADKRVIVRFGPGATVEKYDEPVGTRVTPDLFGQLETLWPVFDRTVLEYKGTVTPSLDDLAVFRMTNLAGLMVRLDQGERWAFRLGLLHEHNSEPNEGKKENDFTTTFSLVYLREGTQKLKPTISTPPPPTPSAPPTIPP